MHPILFQFSHLELRWYGLLTGVGFLVGIWVAAWRAKQENLAREKIWNLGVFIMVGSLVGAKLFYVAAHWSEFWAEPGSMIRSGFVFYGGLAGGIGAALFYTARNNLSVWKVADVFAPSLALGHAFGRLGCFLNGCCYGRRCDQPWAVRFPMDHETHGLPVHPTQLYEASGLIVIFLSLSWWYSRKKFDGQIWWLYAASYAVLRLAVESFRGDSKYFFPIGGVEFTFAQILSLVLLVVAMAFLLKPRQSAT